MDMDILRTVVKKWGNEVGRTIYDCPPEAKFITGNFIFDGKLHYFHLASGVEIKLSEDFKDIIGYDVLDEEKYAWFLLKWL